MQTKASCPCKGSSILKMLGLLFLLCSMLTVTWGDGDSPALNVSVLSPVSAQTNFTTSLPSKTNAATSIPDTTQPSQQTSHPTRTHTTSTHTPTTSAAPKDVSHSNLIDTKHCLPILMVTGGLIIACAILLISTFMLAWKVCHLTRRLKALASNDDLISSSDFWTGKSSKAKVKVETEDKEDTVLLSELDQKPSDAKGESVTANGDKKKKEEEEKEEEKKEEGKNEEGKREEEEKEKEKLAGADEESSSTKPQEDASSIPPAEPEAAAATAD